MSSDGRAARPNSVWFNIDCLRSGIGWGLIFLRLDAENKKLDYSRDPLCAASRLRLSRAPVTKNMHHFRYTDPA